MKYPMSSHRTRQAGLSLIELMIAITIGLILILGLVQIFSASRSAYQLSQGVARSQESGRFALDFLSRDIRMVGHAGCVNDQSLLSADSSGKVIGGNIRMTFLDQTQRDNNDLSKLDYPLRFDVSIQGYEAVGTGPEGTDAVTITTTPTAGVAGDWSPSLPAIIANLSPVKGSDIVVLRYLAPEQTTVTSMTPSSGPTTLGYPDESSTTSSKVASGGTSGLYGIANCSSATVFQASAAPGNTQLTATVSGANMLGLGATAVYNSAKVTENYSYAPRQTWLYRAETMVYYVKVGADGKTPALYRTRWIYAPGTGIGSRTASTDEMVDGVEAMQLLYGQDSAALTAPPSGLINKTGNAGDLGEATASATAAQTWRRVGNVQLGLLVRGTNERAGVAQADTPLRVLNVKVNAPVDGNYRTSYETTIALRNRLFGN